LLDKLSREIDRYREVAGRDELDPEAHLKLVDQLKDSAFNASVTAWQLCDWVFKDMAPDQRQKLNFEKVIDLQNHARRNCRALHLCRQAATASKHWVVDDYYDPDVQVVVAHDGTTGWIAYFVDRGQEQPADYVFDMAYAFWNSFIRDHGVAIALDDAAFADRPSTVG
jgi:hypothetical protein